MPQSILLTTGPGKPTSTETELRFTSEIDGSESSMKRSRGMTRRILLSDSKVVYDDDRVCGRYEERDADKRHGRNIVERALARGRCCKNSTSLESKIRNHDQLALEDCLRLTN